MPAVLTKLLHYWLEMIKAFLNHSFSFALQSLPYILAISDVNLQNNVEEDVEEMSSKRKTHYFNNRGRGSLLTLLRQTQQCNRYSKQDEMTNKLRL